MTGWVLPVSTHLLSSAVSENSSFISRSKPVCSHQAFHTHTPIWSRLSHVYIYTSSCAYIDIYIDIDR